MVDLNNGRLLRKLTTAVGTRDGPVDHFELWRLAANKGCGPVAHRGPVALAGGRVVRLGEA